MSAVIHFVPKADLDAAENLKSFIEVCRNQLTVFGQDLPFDENRWDITDALALRRRSRVRLIFSTWDSANENSPDPLPEPFLSFAKAYMRYQHGLRPTKATGSRLAALRALGKALSENGRPSDPASMTAQELNRAAQLVVDKFSGGVAFRVGGQLEMLASFMGDNGLIATPVIWRNPVSRPRDSVRVGKEFDEARQNKLPSPNALSALANIFHMATEPPDALISSIVAILCSAPDRISELLYLEEKDCEATNVIHATGERVYGLRWRPAKGADPMVKWVVPAMADVVKEAIRRIRALTAPARQVALWYEQNPGKIFLPARCEVLRGCSRISLDDVGRIVFEGEVKRDSIRSWCKTNNVALTTDADGDQWCAFSEVERAVVSNLPSGFPVADRGRGIKYSEVLCISLRNFFHDKRANWNGVVELVGHAQVSDRLGSRAVGRPKSIFDRYGFTEDDGSPIHVTSHQFRHYLNTLTQIGGLSQLDIAKWSGRKDIKQNRAYDHVSARDVVALVRAAIGDESKAIGPLAHLKPSALVSRDKFSRLVVPTAHTTEFGFCIHDFSMTPCQIHMDCLNCNEQVCIKGDEVRTANIRRQRDETERLLAEAMDARGKGYAGANRWVEHQQHTLERLDQICAILDNPAVPDGTVIQAKNCEPASRLQQAASARALKGIGITVLPPSPKPLALPTPEIEEEA